LMLNALGLQAQQELSVIQNGLALHRELLSQRTHRGFE